jgi:RimJ/RimL family protein N-acetyltransferase
LSKESHLNKNFVDAHGTDRVVAQLLKEFDLLTEAEATIEDTNFVYECRYEKTDTSLYVNSNIPTYECHMNWFSKNLVRKDCMHIIFQCGLAKIGYIRLDREKNFYDVSIYVHTKYRSRGFAEIMLNKIVDRVGTQKLQASVHVKNAASLKVFLNCAFNIISKDQNFVRLEYC